MRRNGEENQSESVQIGIELGERERKEAGRGESWEERVIVI